MRTRSGGRRWPAEKGRLWGISIRSGNLFVTEKLGASLMDIGDLLTMVDALPAPALMLTDEGKRNGIKPTSR